MSKLDQAIAAIRAGDKATGKQLLAEILKEDRRNEAAWIWLTQTDITHEEKIKSLQNALKINPDSQATRRKLARLQQPKTTPVMTWVVVSIATIAAIGIILMGLMFVWRMTDTSTSQGDRRQPTATATVEPTDTQPQRQLEHRLRP